jgi:hypothetical protein
MNSSVSLISHRFFWTQIADLMKVAALLVLAILCRYVMTGVATSEVDGAQTVHATCIQSESKMPIDPIDLSTVEL